MWRLRGTNPLSFIYPKLLPENVSSCLRGFDKMSQKEGSCLLSSFGKSLQNRLKWSRTTFEPFLPPNALKLNAR